MSKHLYYELSQTYQILQCSCQIATLELSNFKTWTPTSRFKFFQKYLNHKKGQKMMLVSMSVIVGFNRWIFFFRFQFKFPFQKNYIDFWFYSDCSHIVGSMKNLMHIIIFSKTLKMTEINKKILTIYCLEYTSIKTLIELDMMSLFHLIIFYDMVNGIIFGAYEL